MTEEQATKEAENRWGKFAYAFADCRHMFFGKPWCTVGADLKQRGCGSSFEEAFADADTKEAKCG